MQRKIRPLNAAEKKIKIVLTYEVIRTYVHWEKRGQHNFSLTMKILLLKIVQMQDRRSNYIEQLTKLMPLNVIYLICLLNIFLHTLIRQVVEKSYHRSELIRFRLHQFT